MITRPTAKFRCLAVFSECIFAFCAPQKLRRRFISSTCLNLPHVSQIIAALRALNPHSWQSAKLLLLFTYDSHKLLRIMLNNLRNLVYCLLAGSLLSIPTLWTDKSNTFLPSFPLLRHKARTTFRTKFHTSLHRCPVVFP